MSLIPNENQTSEQQQDAGQETASDRPDFVEPQYWDADTKQVRVKEMARALADTQTSLRNNKDEIRRQIQEELKQGRPESPRGYKVEDLGIPEGVNFQIPDDDKLIEGFRQFAYETGLTNKDFNKAVKIYADNLIENLPNMEKEIEALGENAQSRIGALTQKARSVLNDEEFGSFQNMAMTARDIQVLEKLVQGNASGPSAFDRAKPQSRNIKKEIDDLMSSDAYWRNDPRTEERVQELFQNLARMNNRA